MAARARGERPMPTTRAIAAKSAAAVDEWPLGNDGSSVAATGSNGGRARSTRCFNPVVMSLAPATTTNRNGTTRRPVPRRQASAATTTTATTANQVSPICVTTFRTASLAPVA